MVRARVAQTDRAPVGSRGCPGGGAHRLVRTYLGPLYAPEVDALQASPRSASTNAHRLRDVGKERTGGRLSRTRAVRLARVRRAASRFVCVGALSRGRLGTRLPPGSGQPERRRSVPPSRPRLNALHASAGPATRAKYNTRRAQVARWRGAIGCHPLPDAIGRCKVAKPLNQRLGVRVLRGAPLQEAMAARVRRLARLPRLLDREGSGSPVYAGSTTEASLSLAVRTVRSRTSRAGTGR